ncbi:MAG: proline--tRNA ligase, partial [Spirochaetia bacterium]|nr:proline--tRNA ligase [Spirochaetia bacterium]
GNSCPECGAALQLRKGIEVGNIFQLGTKYSEALNCTFQDEDGTRKPIVMGSYGIGVGRLLACLAEEYCDESGLKLPLAVAPHTVHIVSLIKETGIPEKIYAELSDAGIDVLLDDRKESAGVKFNDADLIGIPVRIVIGNRTLKQDAVEVKLRTGGGDAEQVPIADLLQRISEILHGLT